MKVPSKSTIEVTEYSDDSETQKVMSNSSSPVKKRKWAQNELSRQNTFAQIGLILCVIAVIVVSVSVLGHRLLVFEFAIAYVRACYSHLFDATNCLTPKQIASASKDPHPQKEIRRIGFAVGR